MDVPMAPAAYVVEVGLVEYQWEEKTLVLRRIEGSVSQCRGMPGQGSRSGWVDEQGEDGVGGFQRGNQERG